ncbi:MAG: PilN domain-containing protein [Acidobacteria bacterium]|nr:PilN domain-containing protein [Acidobacteriota bacterium]MCI0621939.1 PilN domain-containing protein [Acidobacteriota bacterium]MCI0721133.1 PilN domain-containing protein [Acidobacteriota bacterium]
MIKIDANLASRPFVNHRKFYLISGALLVTLIGIAYWNFARYQTVRARRSEVNEQLRRDRARFEALGREQEKVLARLQTPETADLLDRLEHANQLIRRRTFSWTRLLNDLERLTPANLQIVTIKPQIAGQGIIVEIVANGRSSRDNVQFVSNLESSGKFYDVSPLHEEISKNPAFVGREIAVHVKYKGQS